MNDSQRLDEAIDRCTECATECCDCPHVVELMEAKLTELARMYAAEHARVPDQREKP